MHLGQAGSAGKASSAVAMRASDAPVGLQAVPTAAQMALRLQWGQELAEHAASLTGQSEGDNADSQRIDWKADLGTDQKINPQTIVPSNVAGATIRGAGLPAVRLRSMQPMEVSTLPASHALAAGLTKGVPGISAVPISKSESREHSNSATSDAQKSRVSSLSDRGQALTSNVAVPIDVNLPQFMTPPVEQLASATAFGRTTEISLDLNAGAHSKAELYSSTASVTGLNMQSFGHIVAIGKSSASEPGLAGDRIRESPTVYLSTGSVADQSLLSTMSDRERRGIEHAATASEGSGLEIPLSVSRASGQAAASALPETDLECARGLSEKSSLADLQGALPNVETARLLPDPSTRGSQEQMALLSGDGGVSQTHGAAIGQMRLAVSQVLTSTGSSGSAEGKIAWNNRDAQATKSAGIFQAGTSQARTSRAMIVPAGMSPAGTAPSGLRSLGMTLAGQVSTDGNSMASVDGKQIVTLRQHSAESDATSVLDAMDKMDNHTSLDGVSDANLARSLGGLPPGGAHSLEVGYQDPTLGYVELRAHMAGGGVHALLGADSAASGVTLEGHLASLADWMHQRATPVESLTVVSSLGREDGGGSITDGSTGRQGAGHSGQGAAGHGYGGGGSGSYSDQSNHTEPAMGSIAIEAIHPASNSEIATTPASHGLGPSSLVLTMIHGSNISVLA